MARPEEWGDGQWPRQAPYVMREIADRIGVEIDPRNLPPSPDKIPAYDIEDSALEMSMREVAARIAAIMGGTWTITDEGKLYLVPLGDAERETVASIGAHNAESLSVSDPLEPWSGVRAIWDGDEFDASPIGEEGTVIVKRGDEVGFAPVSGRGSGQEDGRILEAKIAFGFAASLTSHPEQLLDQWAAWLLAKITGDVYRPFEAANVALDPAVEIGDAVELPDGQSVICAMSGELDSLCVVDVSAPPDEALNTAYPASWAGLL